MKTLLDSSGVITKLSRSLIWYGCMYECFEKIREKQRKEKRRERLVALGLGLGYEL